MQWSDEAIVLSLRPHGETAGILELLTRIHGRHLGVVHGCSSSRIRGALQPGNQLNVTWRARIAEHLGVVESELMRTRASQSFERRSSLTGLNAAIAIAAAVLPEREPHEAAYDGLGALLDAVSGGDLADWGALFVYWELGLLHELGFGLDLTACAVTGTTDDLIYVSPRSGRAVSRAAGREYSDRLLPLPQFLAGTGIQADMAGVAAGLQLTAHFLSRWVLSPYGKEIPFARQRLADLATLSSDPHFSE
ncbi:MAG TPA: DNA repair protein RecO [Micropepsaceae bacterium]|nr:DNA repair protein RecO [Micropepsaceae bacterium]